MFFPVRHPLSRSLLVLAAACFAPPGCQCSSPPVDMETRGPQDAPDQRDAAQETDAPASPDAPPDLLPDAAPDADSRVIDLDQVLTDLTDASDEEATVPAEVDAKDAPVDAAPETISPFPVELDPYGGYADLHVQEGTGFFTTGILQDRAWLIDPLGNAFVSLGVSHVAFGGDHAPDLGYSPDALNEQALYAGLAGLPQGMAAAVIDEKLAAVRARGFNTLGSWSNGSWPQATGKMAYAWNLSFAGGVGGTSVPIPAVSSGGIPDVFHPQFPAMAAEYAEAAIPQEIRADPWNLGYYSDNELKWWGKSYLVQSPESTLADDFIALPADAPGKLAFVAYMQERYQSDIAALNQVYGTAFAGWDELAAGPTLPYDPSNQVQVDDRAGFVGLIAHAYFSAVDAALAQADPNHMNLCARLAVSAPGHVVWEMGEHCDVVSINDYYLKDDAFAIYALGGPAADRWSTWADLVFDAAAGPKPFLLTEWGIRAADSGLPNSYGAGYVTDSQLGRAEDYELAMHWLLDREKYGIRYLAGIHWFEHTDEPPTGRFDGEDSNYGVFTVRQEPYQWLLDAMQQLHLALHSALAADTWPTVLPPPESVTLSLLPDGKLHAEWPPAPAATGYAATLLLHPAGLHPLYGGTWLGPDPTVNIDLSPLPSGWYWVGVVSDGPALLHRGMRVSSPLLVAPPAVPCAPGLQPTLTPCAVAMSNLPVDPPAAGPGLSYATLTAGTFAPDALALQLRFIPSSLGFLGLPAGADSEIRVTIDLPPTTASAGQSLAFALLARPAMPPSGTLAPASRFVRVRAESADGLPLAEWSLADQDVPLDTSTDILLPIPGDLTFARLIFYVDLWEADLPMESLLDLTVSDPQVL